MQDFLAEEKLIEYAKPYLKARGFKKKNKRWTKDIGEFTLCFYIQGSAYSKEDYYIRPGVFINAMPMPRPYYGHFMTGIEITTPEEILSKFEAWCEEWTNKALIKERLLEFIEWDKRNPLKKRQDELVDYEADPVPAEEFLWIDIGPTEPTTKQYILDNF